MFATLMLCLDLTCGRGALQGLLLGELTRERAYMARHERLSHLPHVQKITRRTLEEMNVPK
jgi:hypothetical protein